MPYQYRFCPTCATQRAAFGYTCSVCGGTVRHSDRPVAVSAGADPSSHRPYSLGWRVITPRDKERKLLAA